MSTSSKVSNRAVKTEILIICGIAALAIVSLASMWLAGVNSRVFAREPANIVLLNEERDAYRVWRGSGIKGRTIVHFGKHMPTKKINGDRLRRLATTAGQPRNESMTALTNANYLYAAARANYVRKIFGVIPDKEWPKVRLSLENSEIYTVTDAYVAAWIDGLPLRSGKLGALPSINELVVLNFSSDYFADNDTSAEAVVDKLKRAGIKFDLVTITLPASKEPHYKAVTAKIRRFRRLLAKFK